MHAIAVICSLLVEYTPTYPDELPHLTLEDDIEGELSPSERSSLLDGLREQGEQSLGMAMVFTLVGWLREELTKVLEERNRKEQEEADRKYREAEEVSTRVDPWCSSKRLTPCRRLIGRGSTQTRHTRHQGIFQGVDGPTTRTSQQGQAKS